MKSWIRWLAIILAVVVIAFFIVRAFSSSPVNYDNSSGAVTTSRDDIDLVFDGDRRAGASNSVNGESLGESAPSGQPAHYCADEDRDVEVCEDIDEPVCGWYDLSHVECAPDDPCVRSVFPNVCRACQNQNIEYWTEGDCPLHSN